MAPKAHGGARGGGGLGGAHAMGGGGGARAMGGGGARAMGGGAPAMGGGGARAMGGGAPAMGGGAPAMGGGTRAMGGGAPAMGGGAPAMRGPTMAQPAMQPGYGGGYGGGGYGYRPGPSPGMVIAEAAVVGVVAGAVVSSATRPRNQGTNVVVVDGGGGGAVYAGQGGRGGGAVVYAQPGQGRGNSRNPGQGAAMADPSLNIGAVHMPECGMEKRGDVTFYRIEVTSQEGATWFVMRRYNDFHTLHSKLGAGAKEFPDAPFPGKTMCAVKDDKLEGRRRGLEMWLTRTLQQPQSQGAWKSLLRAFVEAGAVATSNLTAAPSAAAAPPRPAEAADAAAGAAVPLGKASSGQALQVKVPPGLAPGELFAVTVPDGRQLTVAVPDGAAPGSDLTLWFNPAAGTLTALS